MAQSREKSGCTHLDISETGKRIARKVSAYSSIRIRTSLKECGLKTRDMAKAPIGEMKAAN